MLRSIGFKPTKKGVSVTCKIPRRISFDFKCPHCNKQKHIVLIITD